MKRPFWIAGLSAFFSILLCMLCGPDARYWVMSAAAAPILAALIFRKKRMMKAALLFSAVWVGAALLFAVRYDRAAEACAAYSGKTLSVAGELTEAPQRTQNGYGYTIRNCSFDGEQTKLRVRIYSALLFAAEPGDTLIFPEADLFEEDDADEYYYHRLSEGVWITGYVYDGQVERAEKVSLLTRVERLRQKTLNSIRNAMLSDRAGIAAALLLGRKDGLSGAFKAQIRTAGASHIFAVSGMHLSLWSGVLFLILQKRAKTKKWANAAAILFTVFCVLFTGASPSVLRAGVMLIAVYAGRMFRRQADPLNSLGLSAAVMLAANPFLAGNLSFLLSYLATASIFLVTPYLQLKNPSKRGPVTAPLRLGVRAVNVVTLTFGVLLFTVPVSAVFFGGFSLLSPVSSLVFVLPAEACMLLTAAALISAPVPAVSGLLFKTASACCGTIEWLAERLSRIGGAYVPLNRRLVLMWIALSGAAALCFMLRRGDRRRSAKRALLVAGALGLALCALHRIADAGRVDLYLPDAGSDTGVSVAFGGGSAVQIGTGARYETAQTAVSFLKENGVVDIRALVIPDSSDASARQSAYFVNRFALRQIAAPAGVLPNESITILRDAGDRFALPGGAAYENRVTPHLRAGVLLAGSIKLVLSYDGTNNLAFDRELQTGDVLICRDRIPAGADPERFTEIYILSDDPPDPTVLPENARVVCGTGGAAVRLKEGALPFISDLLHKNAAR